MGRTRSRRNGPDRSFRWQRLWIAGPTCILAVLLALSGTTSVEIRARRSADADPDAPQQEPPSASSSEPARVLPPSPDSDAARLRDQPDLGALPGARRLWLAGTREPIYDAIESRAASSSLRRQLLLLAAAEPNDRLRQAARGILEEKPNSQEMVKLAESLAQAEIVPSADDPRN
jgi:hypothetical protein